MREVQKMPAFVLELVRRELTRKSKKAAGERLGERLDTKTLSEICNALGMPFKLLRDGNQCNAMHLCLLSARAEEEQLLRELKLLYELCPTWSRQSDKQGRIPVVVAIDKRKMTYVQRELGIGLGMTVMCGGVWWCVVGRLCV